MLKNFPVAATIPVSDIKRARDFYSNKLGLGEPKKMPLGELRYQCGDGTQLYLYPTEQNAGKSPATLVCWLVEDAEAMRDKLRGKGITFEEYDMPGIKTKDGIVDMNGAKGAWFKDPDGNILNIYDLAGVREKAAA